MAGITYKFQWSDRHFVGSHEDKEREAEHSQVKNRIQVFDMSLTYALSKRWTFSASLPYQILERSQRNNDFEGRGARVLGVSIDNEYVHLAWRKSHPDLRDLPFPMLSDLKRELTGALGILHPTEGVAMRATFIVDPEGLIRFVSVNDLNVGRNPQEVLRVLDALQTDELCPCNWQKGEEVLKVA